MLQEFIFGLLLGWGAAIPIGPINLEIIRRNLRFGTPAGVGLGFGAGFADVTYLSLLSFGALQILVHPLVIKIIGIIGALILAWFGFSALIKAAPQSASAIKEHRAKRSFIRNLLEGYVLTLLNPMTLIFWSSISATLAVKTHEIPHAIIYAGIGVLCGTLSWSNGLNIFVHFTRHKLSNRAMQILNIVGGVILLGFAIVGLWRAFA